MTDVQSFRELVEHLIEEKDWQGLRHQLEHMQALDLALLLTQLSTPEDVIAFRLLPHQLSTKSFELLTPEKQVELVESLAQRKHKLSSLLNNLSPDDRTQLLEELPGSVSQQLIQLLTPDERKVAMDLLGYPEDSIGRLMTPNYVAVRPSFTIEQTIEHIQKYGEDSETLNVIYVVTPKWELIDDLRLAEILLAPKSSTIADLMDHHFVSLEAFDDQETAVQMFQDHDRVALPVTDSKGTLIGIVTFDDVMDIAEEEATEDFHRFGSIQDAVFNPLKATAGFLYRKRIFWLFTLVFMNVFSGATLSLYENTIKSTVSLLFFLPILLGSGGNAGAQSATLMVRALATNAVEMKDWLHLLGKELIVALLLGLTLGMAAAGIAAFQSPEIILVVLFTMISIVLVGALAGLSLPFIFTKLKLDPATASAPLITSIADISGVIIYMSIATWYLNL